MPRKQTKTRKKAEAADDDGLFLLKIVLYVILGVFWLRFSSPLVVGSVSVGGFPVGLIVGLIFASHDHFQVDRKIEYVILIVMTVISFFLPAGIII